MSGESASPIDLTEEHFVYRGQMELFSWSHTSSHGMQVRLRLGMTGEILDRFNSANLQKKSRRRTVGGGGLYTLSVVDPETGVLVDNIGGWFKSSSYGNKQGAVVTFELPDETALDTFRYFQTADASDLDQGKVFEVIIVEYDDEGVPINQAKRQRVLDAAERKRQGLVGGPRSKHCAQICRRSDFITWFCVEYLETDRPLNEEQLASKVRNICCISSRAELDHDEIAWQRWRSLESQFMRSTGVEP